jgi:hypothetical protein
VKFQHLDALCVNARTVSEAMSSSFAGPIGASRERFPRTLSGDGQFRLALDVPVDVIAPVAASLQTVITPG